jgi:elongation factor P hydroxylase
MHQYEDLIFIFNNCFLKEYNTKLVKGGDEPLYLPADKSNPHHSVIFAHGFYSSALHECSHWLIAGEERRKLLDFGYWYAPDGRTAAEQEIFQKVEVKPQALEWILSLAASFKFSVSIDNLNGEAANKEQFKEDIYQQVKTYCNEGLPKRAKSFRDAICRYYGTNLSLKIEDFNFGELR